jgi:hypothetical protein
MIRIKGKLQTVSNRNIGTRIYSRQVFDAALEDELKRQSEIDELVSLIMDSQPSRVSELPRKQIVP